MFSGFDVRQKRVTDPLQRCAYCLQCPDPHKYPTHSLGKFKPVGTKSPTNGSYSKKVMGCPRYEESIAHREEASATFLANRKKTSRHYFVPPPSWAPRGAQIRVCRQIYIYSHFRIVEAFYYFGYIVPTESKRTDGPTTARDLRQETQGR